MAKNEATELVDYIRTLGFSVSLGNDGHYHVYKDGKPVMKANGGAPVTLASTPGTSGWRNEAVAMLIGAKVIDADPKKKEQMSLASRDAELVELRERARAADEARKTRAAAEAAAKPPDKEVLHVLAVIKSTLETLKMSKTDLVRVAMKAGVAAGIRVPKTENAGQVALANFMKFPNKGLSPEAYRYWVTALQSIGAWYEDGEEAVVLEPPAEKEKPAAQKEPTQPAEPARVVKKEKNGRTRVIFAEPLAYDSITHIQTDLKMRVIGMKKGEPATKQGGGRLRCSCGYIAGNLVSLKSHVRSTHVEAQCPECGEWRAFAGLARHRTATHNVAPKGKPAKKKEEPVASTSSVPAIDMKGVARRIRAARVQKGWSLNRLARVTSVSKSFWVRSEMGTGGGQLTMDIVMDAAEGLGVPLNDLLYQDGKVPVVMAPVAAETAEEEHGEEADPIAEAARTVAIGGLSVARVSIEALQELKDIVYVQGMLDGLGNGKVKEKLEPTVARLTKELVGDRS